MKLIFTIAVLFIALTGVNLFLMLIRDRPSGRAASRDTVLHTAEATRVVAHSIVEPGVLEFILKPAGGATAWIVSPETGAPDTVTASHPRIRLSEGSHTYRVESIGSSVRPEITFSAAVDFRPGGIFAGTARTHSRDGYHVSNLSIPAFAAETYPLAEWCGADLDSSELERARETIAGLFPDDSETQEKIALLGAHLLDILDDKRGIPDERMQAASPLETYRLALAGESGIWCDNFSIVYYLFANASHIPTRRVSAGGSIDGVRYSQHAFCESYVPEQRRWACVDLNSRILMVRNRSGQVLSTIDLADLVRTQSYDAEALAYIDGEPAIVPYGRIADPHRYYLSKDAELIYRLPERSANDLSRYFQTSRQLVIANHDIPSDYGQRIAFFWLWIVAGTAFAAAVITKRYAVQKRKGAG